METNIEKRFEAAAQSKTLKNIIETLSLDQKAVLDIGCSNGEALAHFGKGSVGITVNPTEVESGKAKKLDIRLGNAELPIPFEKKFDALFANNLFEHLYAPHSFLQITKEYLQPEGVVVLGVPCIPKFAWLMRASKKFRGSLADAHINFFTYESLRLTVERAGWDIVMMRGFHFKNPLIDRLFRVIYPHFYVVARPNPNFRYSIKRQKELEGYKGTGILP